MDPLLGFSDFGSLFGQSTTEPSSFGGGYGDSSRTSYQNEVADDPTYSGAPTGMELAPLYTSSSGSHGEANSITNILRRYRDHLGSNGRHEEDYEENEETYVNYDATGAHIGARVSRTQQTPFGPATSDVGVQMSVGHGGIAFRSTTRSSFGLGNGGLMMMSISSRSSPFGGLGGGMFNPLGGLFSPFGGLLSPLSGMLAIGSDPFSHSPHCGLSSPYDGLQFGTSQSVQSSSGPVIEEIEENNETTVQTQEKKTLKRNKNAIDPSLGLGLLPMIEDSDEEDSGDAKDLVIIQSANGCVNDEDELPLHAQRLDKEPELSEHKNNELAALPINSDPINDQYTLEKRSDNLQSVSREAISYEEQGGRKNNEACEDFQSVKYSSLNCNNQGTIEERSGSRESQVIHRETSTFQEKKDLRLEDEQSKEHGLESSSYHYNQNISSEFSETRLSPVVLKETPNIHRKVVIEENMDTSCEGLKNTEYRTKGSYPHKEGDSDNTSRHDFCVEQQETNEDTTKVEKETEILYTANSRKDSVSSDVSLDSSVSLDGIPSTAGDDDGPVEPKDKSESITSQSPNPRSPTGDEDILVNPRGSDTDCDDLKKALTDTGLNSPEIPNLLSDKNVKAQKKLDFPQATEEASCFAKETSGQHVDRGNFQDDMLVSSLKIDSDGKEAIRKETSTGEKDRYVKKKYTKQKFDHLDFGFGQITTPKSKVDHLEFGPNQTITTEFMKKGNSVSADSERLWDETNKAVVDKAGDVAMTSSFRRQTGDTDGDTLFKMLEKSSKENVTPAGVFSSDEGRKGRQTVEFQSHSFTDQQGDTLNNNEGFSKLLERKESQESSDEDRDSTENRRLKKGKSVEENVKHSHSVDNTRTPRGHLNQQEDIKKRTVPDVPLYTDPLHSSGFEHKASYNLIPKTESSYKENVLKEYLVQDTSLVRQSPERAQRKQRKGLKQHTHTHRSDSQHQHYDCMCQMSCPHVNTHEHLCSCARGRHTVCSDCQLKLMDDEDDDIFDHPEWQHLKQYGSSAIQKKKKNVNKNVKVSLPTDSTIRDTGQTSPDAYRAVASPGTIGGNPIPSSASTAKSVSQSQDLTSLVESIGLTLKDVYPDGNCLFTAVADQLRIRGDFSYTSRDLRQAAVDYLKAHPKQEDGTPFSSFLADHESDWEQYLLKMRQDGHWGDHFTIMALANVLDQRIIIYSGTDTLHSTVVEPSRKHRDQAVDKGEDKEEGEETTVIRDNDDSPDNENEMYLGHISHSHYVSLRPKNWKETLIKNLSKRRQPAFAGLSSDSKTLDSNEDVSVYRPLATFRTSDINILLNYVKRGDFIDEMQLPDPLGNTKYMKQNCVGDVYNGLEFSFIQPASRQKSFPYYRLCTMLDTTVVSDTRLLTSDKDLVAVTDDCKPWQMILVPVKPNIWYPMLKSGNRHMCLKQIFPPNEMSRGMIYAFQSQWPVEAEEWKVRSRKHGWPSPDKIDDIIKGGATVVPAKDVQPGSNSHYKKVPQVQPGKPKEQEHVGLETRVLNTRQTNPEDPDIGILWEYNFDIAEVIICRENMNRLRRKFYCILKNFFQFAFDGKTVVTDKHIKHLFFFICEECSLEDLKYKPADCMMYALNKLEDFLKSRHIPCYFMRKINMLGEASYEDIAWHVKMIEFLKRNLMVFMYFLFDHHGMFQWFRLYEVFNILNEEAKFRGDKISSGDGYYKIGAIGVQSWAEIQQFTKARVQVDIWMKELSMTESDPHLSKDDFLDSVMNGLVYEDRWLFAFYTDILDGTHILPDMLRGQNCFNVSVLFGKETMEILREETSLAYLEVSAPVTFLCENMVEFAKQFGDMLRKDLHAEKAYQAAIPYFLHENTHDILLRVEKDQTEHKVYRTYMYKKVWTLREMFLALYDIYYASDPNVLKFRDLMNLFEELCNFSDRQDDFTLLAQLWRHFGEEERANEAVMKAQSLQVASSAERTTQL